MFSPLRDRVFRRLFAAQILALTGTGLATVALALLAYDLAGAEAGAVLGTALASASARDNPITQSITHLQKARQLLEDGQHSSALDEAGQAIEFDPFSGDSYLVRAKAWASLGDSQRAINDAGRAIRFGLDSGDRQEAVALMIRLRSKVR